jgi:hypothetical protein
MNVNVTQLRQNLPTYLKRVRQGERIRDRKLLDLPNLATIW